MGGPNRRLGFLFSSYLAYSRPLAVDRLDPRDVQRIAIAEPLGDIPVTGIQADDDFTSAHGGHFGVAHFIVRAVRQ